MLAAAKTIWGWHDLSTLLVPLFFCHGLNGKGVNTASQFVGQDLVDTLVTLHESLTVEVIGYHNHFEVGLGPRRDIVHVALVDDFQSEDGDGLDDFLFNGVLGVHGLVHSFTQ